MFSLSLKQDKKISYAKSVNLTIRYCKPSQSKIKNPAAVKKRKVFLCFNRSFRFIFYFDDKNIKPLCFFVILQGVETLFARADFNHVFHVVNEYFSVADVTGMQRCFGCGNYLFDRDCAYNDFHFVLGQ